MLLHQWIITSYPGIVHSYVQYNDTKSFHSLSLDCAVPTSIDNEHSNKLTAVVTYYTRYKLQDGTNATISFGLGKHVQVNAIIGLPTIRLWKLVLDLDDNKFYSKVLNL